ncbi:MAG TPA: hypothetical protein GX714_01420 [Chloroflexi bacterium]|jgi:carbonic anhydrase|nr:hypothetical protein [Chloroflexota bacterium]
MAHGTFGTAINCMDGRAQLPVITWLKEQYGLDYVDMITEAGAAKALLEGTPEQAASVLARVRVSVEKHGSRIVAIVGHDDCAGNPVSEEEHRRHIAASVAVARAWGLPVEVIGLWLGNDWQIECIDA